MRAVLLAAAMACGLATGAEASVTYTLTNQVYNQAALDAQPHTGEVYFTLVISDAAVARGSFNLQETAGSQIFTLSGDVADFVSASTSPTPGLGQTVTATSAYYNNVDLSLTFAGGVASGRIGFLGSTEDLQLSGAGGVFSGTFGSDYNNCPNVGFRACGVTGQLTASASPSAVPEPVSLALLGSGLLGLAGVRRVRR